MNPIHNHTQAISWMIKQFSKGKYLYYFIPGLALALLFWNFTSTVETWSSNSYGEDIPWIGGWVSKIAQGGLSFLGFLIYQLFIFLVLTVLSPMNTFLAEKVETDLIGRSFGFDLERFILDLVRMVGVVIVVLTLEFFFMGLWAFVSWIFGFDFFDEVMYFLIAAFFYGYSFYDYSLERHSIGLRSSLKFAKTHWIEMVLTGGIFTLSFALPIFGLPIFAVLATIISSHVFLRLSGALNQN